MEIQTLFDFDADPPKNSLIHDLLQGNIKIELSTGEIYEETSLPVIFSS